MRQLVEMVDDVALAERFRDLGDRLPVTPAALAAGPLMHNLDAPIADQLTAIVVAEAGGSVDELLLAAPFYDDDAEAVAHLLTGLKPRRVAAYVTGVTSVNGARLAERLTSSGAHIDVHTYEPDRFVHAKLVGVIAGHRGWLLSGSTNLSRAALTRTAHAGGNVELAVLAQIDPSQMRAAFVPPGMVATAQSLDTLASLRFTSDREPGGPAVRLISATAIANGCVELSSDPPAQAGWLLDDLTERQPITLEPSGRAVTAGPLSGRLVRLVDTDDTVLSNRVVVDDPAGLKAALANSDDRRETGRPPEFADTDLESPLAKGLGWLHRNFVMDVTERLTAPPTGGVAPEEAEEQADEDLWERLEREQLAHDPRATTYGRMWSRASLDATDPVVELLEVLRARAPANSASGRMGSSLLAHLLEETTKPPVIRWKRSSRIRVRARNVLRRWAAAQTDPRLVWIDPLAPAGNFAAMVSFLARLRLDRARDAQQVELDENDLDDIWLLWLRPFVGIGEGDGWLDRLDAASLALARERLPEWVPEATAALCWLAIQPGSGYRERVVTWQRVLSAAQSYRLLDQTTKTAGYLTAVTGRAVTSDQVDGQLLDAMDFIDDPLWCARTIGDLALEGLELQAPPGAPHVHVRLDVRGILDPLVDPRVPRLIVGVRRYRRCNGVALYAADADWRLVLATGTTIAYRPSSTSMPVESLAQVTDDRLERLTGAGGVLASLFAVVHSA